MKLRPIHQRNPILNGK